MCRVLRLSESGYYRWLRNREKRNRRQLLAVKIDAILAEHPDNRNYGVDRVCLALEQDGVDVSRRTVYRVLFEPIRTFLKCSPSQGHFHLTHSGSIPAGYSPVVM